MVSLALFVHGDIQSEAGAERKALAEEARLVPALHHDPVAADQLRVAFVDPRDRAPGHRAESVAVLDARRNVVVVIGLETVDDGGAREQGHLVALPRRPRFRAAVARRIVPAPRVAYAEVQLSGVHALPRLDVVQAHLVEPAPRRAPGRSCAVEHAVAVCVGVVAGALAARDRGVVVAIGSGTRREAEPRAERPGPPPELQR